MARVLITGATGFIGSHLLRDCLERGDEVMIVARPESEPWRLADMMGRFDLQRVQPSDYSAMSQLVRGFQPERVFHMAAVTRFNARRAQMDLTYAFICNVEPLQTLLSALAQLDVPPKSFVRTGTLAELGEQSEVAMPDAREMPENAYGISALIGTHLTRLARERSGLPAVTARLSLTYGGDQSSDFLIPDMIRKGLEGTAPRLRQPAARRDLLHVSDVVAGLQLIADHASALPDTVSLSTGKPISMAELSNMIARLVGRSSGAGRAIPEPGQGEPVLSCHPSPEILNLGWDQRVLLEAGLRQVIDWERDILAMKSKECRA